MLATRAHNTDQRGIAEFIGDQPGNSVEFIGDAGKNDESCHADSTDNAATSMDQWA